VRLRVVGRSYTAPAEEFLDGSRLNDIRVFNLLEAVWERRRNEVGRSGSVVIPEGCDTFSGVTDVEPDRPRAA